MCTVRRERRKNSKQKESKIERKGSRVNKEIKKKRKETKIPKKGRNMNAKNRGMHQ